MLDTLHLFHNPIFSFQKKKKKWISVYVTVLNVVHPRVTRFIHKWHAVVFLNHDTEYYVLISFFPHSQKYLHACWCSVDRLGVFLSPSFTISAIRFGWYCCYHPRIVQRVSLTLILFIFHFFISLPFLH